MYVRLDPRVSPLIHIVKAWARQPQVDLNDAARATFNSFSITLMILGYLQSIVPPVLPCIQASEGDPLSFCIPLCKHRRLTWMISLYA
jgi:DNA polymerase sigma